MTVDAAVVKHLTHPLGTGDARAVFLGENHSAHPKVAEFGFVGEVVDIRHVAHSRFAQFVFDVEDVFEGCALTGTRTVTRSNHQALAFSFAHQLDALFEFLGRVVGVLVGAHG